MQPPHEEEQYLNLIRKIQQEGSWEHGRNGRIKSIFGHSMRFSLCDGTIPILTTKKMAWKACFHELMFFIRGQTSNTVLQNQGVHIWDGNSTREYLDANGFSHYSSNELGPIYGYQWRNWNRPYKGGGIKPKEEEEKEAATTEAAKDANSGIDQLQKIICNLKNPQTRSSRRHILTAWNPEQIEAMVLPPCHILAQFHVREDKYLSCALYQRSADVGLGVPFNIASYSFLTHLLAHHCGLVAEEFVHFIGNAHIYEKHMTVLLLQCRRSPYAFPKINVSVIREDINDYSIEDIHFTQPYMYLPALKMEMIA